MYTVKPFFFDNNIYNLKSYSTNVNKVIFVLFYKVYWKKKLQKCVISYRKIRGAYFYTNFELIQTIN